MIKYYIVLLSIPMILSGCSHVEIEVPKTKEISKITEQISHTEITIDQGMMDTGMVVQPRKIPVLKKIGNTYTFTQTGNYENTGTITLLLGEDGYYYLTPKIRVYNPEECDNTNGLFDWADEGLSWLSWGFSQDLFDLVRTNTGTGSVGCFDTKSYKFLENSYNDANDNEDKNGTYFIGGEETWHPALRWTTQTGGVEDTHDEGLIRFPDGSLYFRTHKLEGITDSKEITSIDTECIKSRDKVWCGFYGNVKGALAQSFHNKKGALYVDENSCYIVDVSNVYYLEECHPKNIYCDMDDGKCSDDRFVWEIHWGDDGLSKYHRSKK